MSAELTTPANQSEPVLKVSDLTVRLSSDLGHRDLVRSASFELLKGRTLGIVGESGSGKSLMVRSIMDLLPASISVTDPTSVVIAGTPVLTLNRKAAQKFWGPVVSMVFQDARMALNPVRTIGAQLVEPMRIHLQMSKAQARERAVDLLAEAGLSDPRRRLAQYPHELSGGMCQRVVIAIALACEPSILIADEPTSALDVTVQRQILELLARLAESRQMSTLLITHDIGVVAHYAERVLVMTEGRIVEQGLVRDVLVNPQDAYTQRLIGSARAARASTDDADEAFLTIGVAP